VAPWQTAQATAPAAVPPFAIVSPTAATTGPLGGAACTDAAHPVNKVVMAIQLIV